jgi:hypothetical protein
MKKKQEEWNGQAFIIGRYQLGYRMVTLWAEPGTGGAWLNLCKNKEEAQIHVHMQDRDPAYSFGHLCHEIWEMATDELHCLFRKTNAFMDSASDTVHFHFDHNQHTEINCRASYFVWQCMEDFKAAHRKFAEHAKKALKAAPRTTVAKKRRKR